jgi:hypothetical protein
MASAVRPTRSRRPICGSEPLIGYRGWELLTANPQTTTDAFEYRGRFRARHPLSARAGTTPAPGPVSERSKHRPVGVSSATSAVRPRRSARTTSRPLLTYCTTWNREVNSIRLRAATSIRRSASSSCAASVFGTEHSVSWCRIAKRTLIAIAADEIVMDKPSNVKAWSHRPADHGDNCNRRADDSPRAVHPCWSTGDRGLRSGPALAGLLTECRAGSNRRVLTGRR